MSIASKVRAQCESLEPRRLLSAELKVLVDVNTQADWSSVDFHAVHAGRSVYSALVEGQRKLFSTDGTHEGTVRLAERIQQYIGDINGRSMFAMGNAQGMLLTDGTLHGTTVLGGANLPAAERITLSTGSFTTMYHDGVLYFQAGRTATGFELWRTDGTAGGTEAVADVRPGTSSSAARPLASIADRLWFVANAGSGAQIWSVGNGQYVPVLEPSLVPGASAGNYLPVSRIGEDALVLANPGSGPRLYRTDGTVSGTTELAGLPSLSGVPYAFSFGTLQTDEYTYIQLQSSTSGENPTGRLIRTDGTAAGTLDLTPAGGGLIAYTSSTLATLDGNTVFFNAFRPDVGTELFATDGTIGGTSLLSDTAPGTQSGRAFFPIAHDGKLYFGAFQYSPSGHLRVELFRTTGLPGGVEQVIDLHQGQASSFNAAMQSFGEGLLVGIYLEADGADVPMLLNTSSGGLSQIPLGDVSTLGSDPRGVAIADDKVYFLAKPKDGPFVPFEFDQNTRQLTPLSTMLPNGQVPPDFAQSFTPVGSKVFFTANNGTVWVKDGGVVRPVGYNFATGTTAGNLVAVGEQLMFTDQNFNLWKSDGTAAGTRLIAPLPLGGVGA